jgi:hypothetical protein
VLKLPHGSIQEVINGIVKPGMLLVNLIMNKTSGFRIRLVGHVKEL